MLPLFSLTILLGAALLFLVEPMIARMALPRLGGSPAVWNTCVLFFQAALLAGYALAHWSINALGVRRQAVLYMTLVLTPLVMLPAAVRGTPAPGESPVLWLLGSLAAGVGLPFVVVATAGPSLQRWFASSGHRAAADPYFLYAAGNAGSLLALLAYPLLLEPRLGLRDQARLWTVLYWAFAALTLACGAMAIAQGRRAAANGSTRAAAPAEPETEEVGPWRRLSWVALAFIPSSLSLGVTQYLTTDIAAVPLLWVVPLAVYLLTFIVAFSARPIPLWLPARLLPMGAIGLTIAFLIDATRPAWVVVSLHLVVLALAGLMCHTRLALDRPRPGRLTLYFLLVAVGGALGGVFNALVAPAIFNSVLEYPIVLVLALLARPRTPSRFDTLPAWLVHATDFVLPLLIGGLALFLDERVPHDGSGLGLAVTIGVPALLLYILAPRPVGFALGIAAMLAIVLVVQERDGRRLHRERTFFGVYTVASDGVFTTLTHGTTRHGLQYVAEGFRHIPLGYYHPDAPIGGVFKTYGAAAGPGGGPLLRRVGVVGMGTGALAAYAQPGRRVTFHEIDPAVVAIAGNPAYFTYLRACRGEWDVMLGDGRLTIGDVPESVYGLLVLDAFSSDAIPVHLLTREAVAAYLPRVSPGGLIAFHISNNFVDLEPVLASAAAELNLVAVTRRDDLSPEQERESGRASCVWMVMARQPSDLAALRHDARWLPALSKPGVRAWTDDFSNIWSVFQWD